jgi:hypothetical protein
LLLVLAASDRRPSSPRRLRRTSALASLGLLALLLVGCSAPGKVDDFNEDTQANFEQACREANDNLSDTEADRLCTCWYDAIVNGGMSFDAFKNEDENIREAIDAGQFNNDDDFQREAPTLYTVVTENCQEQGPQAD